jgi:hypothetical protein
MLAELNSRAFADPSTAAGAKVELPRRVYSVANVTAHCRISCSELLDANSHGHER